MNVGDIVSVSGCITKEKFIAGRTLAEIEKILGFRAGRFAGGIAVVVLTELPGLQQFDLAAYSNVATHRHRTPAGLNIDKLKADAKASWATTGFERLVKVRPAVGHDEKMDPDIQYPPGQGAPQWIAKVLLRGKVVAVVTDYPKGRYVAADAVRR
ncbi:MAG TPA: hypothetical protein VK776_10085 [Bryobacteraceae bacterium]|jgi:hypothetical protein|nr:hypothetical protein [Bryobacteraceae bacterium]